MIDGQYISKKQDVWVVRRAESRTSGRRSERILQRRLEFNLFVREGLPD